MNIKITSTKRGITKITTFLDLAIILEQASHPLTFCSNVTHVYFPCLFPINQLDLSAGPAQFSWIYPTKHCAEPKHLQVKTNAFRLKSTPGAVQQFSVHS